MVDVALQLYTLRGLDASVPELLDLAGEVGYDGVEFAYRVRDAPLPEVRDALDRNDLAVASAHVSIGALEDAYAETTAFYDALGAETLVVPWLDPKHFESRATVEAVAKRLDTLAADLEADGFRAAYHTHDHEFVPLAGEGESVGGTGETTAPGETALDALLAATDDRVGLELDVGWAAVAGADPAALLDRYGDRVSHVHAADADVERGASVAFGDGDVDFDAVVASARDAGAEWLVYEHDDPPAPRTSIDRGEAGIRGSIRAAGETG